jgi:Copper binding periplasmic protein CusF
MKFTPASAFPQSGDLRGQNSAPAREIPGGTLYSSGTGNFSVSCRRIDARRMPENRCWMEVPVPGRNRFDARKIILSMLLIAPAALLMGGCSSPKPAAEQTAAPAAPGPKRYALTGRVVSVDKPKLQVVVDGADIPDFMSAMTMGYDVKSADALDPLSPEDQIKADVVVNGNDVHLENIVVTKKAPAKTPAAGKAAEKPDKQ